ISSPRQARERRGTQPFRALRPGVRNTAQAVSRALRFPFRAAEKPFLILAAKNRSRSLPRPSPTAVRHPTYPLIHAKKARAPFHDCPFHTGRVTALRFTRGHIQPWRERTLNRGYVVLRIGNAGIERSWTKCPVCCWSAGPLSLITGRISAEGCDAS